MLLSVLYPRGFSQVSGDLWLCIFKMQPPKHTHTKTNQILTRSSVWLSGIVGWLVSLLTFCWEIRDCQFLLLGALDSSDKNPEGKTSQVWKGSWRRMQTLFYSPYLFNLSPSWCFQRLIFFQRIHIRSYTSVEEAIWGCHFILFYFLHFKISKAFLDILPNLDCEWSYTGKFIQIASPVSLKFWATWSLVEIRAEQHTELGI